MSAFETYSSGTRLESLFPEHRTATILPHNRGYLLCELTTHSHRSDRQFDVHVHGPCFLTHACSAAALGILLSAMNCWMDVSLPQHPAATSSPPRWMNGSGNKAATSFSRAEASISELRLDATTQTIRTIHESERLLQSRVHANYVDRPLKHTRRGARHVAPARCGEPRVPEPPASIVALADVCHSVITTPQHKHTRQLRTGRSNSGTILMPRSRAYATSDDTSSCVYTSDGWYAPARRPGLPNTAPTATQTAHTFAGQLRVRGRLKREGLSVDNVPM